MRAHERSARSPVARTRKSRMRHAANALKFARKLKVAKVGGGDRVLPNNNPASAEAAQAATPTAA